MQQFKALLKKEIFGYVRSSLAAVLFFIYLFISLGSAFYFGSYLAMHDTSVYSLFFLQPYILIMIVPAVTMKLWSEEYKSGTAEFLLTQPISYYKPALAKVAAAFLFCLFMSLFFLPTIFCTAGWLMIDWGNIILSFIGLWFLMLLFCILGCLISALNRSVILSYLISMFAMTLWVIFPITKLQEVYNNFLFAEIGLPDVLYFVLFSGVLFGVNVVVGEYGRSVIKYKEIKFGGAFLLILLGVVLLNAALFNFLVYKGDFTAAQVYSPKDKTEEIISEITGPISIDIYAAKDYVGRNTDYYHYYEQVLRFLKKYEYLSGGMISVHTNMVAPFSEMEEQVLDNGLYFEENSQGSRNYFGAVLRDSAGKEVVIKQFLLERRPYLEKDIDVALLKLIKPEMVKNVGVFLDATQNIDAFTGVLINLENDYHVRNVSPQTYEFSPQLDMLVLINPKDYPAYFMYALDQYVMRGGKVVVFFDMYTEGQPLLTNMADLQIVDFFNRWGIKLVPEMTDNGLVDKNFGQRLFSLKLNRAISFEVENDDLSVKPFITGEKGLIGAVLTGKLLSMYKYNPYLETDIGQNMLPYLPMSLHESQVALVGDVDVLEDDNWIDMKSADKNPYSVVEKTGNGSAVRALFDYMLGNDVYQQLPLNTAMLNKDSIGEQIQKMSYDKYEVEYQALRNRISDQKLALFEASGEDWERMDTMLRVGEAGREIASHEKKLQHIEYLMNQLYSRKVGGLLLGNILFVPLLSVIVLLLALHFVNKRRQSQVKEKFNA